MANELDTLYDIALNAMKAGAIRVSACSAQPANYAGIAAVQLGIATISSADFTGPADHTPSGRKLTFGGKAIVNPTTGTVTYLVFHDNSAVMYASWPITSQAVTDTQTWNIPAKILGILDPP